MGNYIVIRHTDGLKTIYGHLNDILVKKNSYVRQGRIIGSVGKTGNSRSNRILSHLHFELRKDGVPQDPLTYL
ncbi:MAG: M23 family metallopeptidase, partial [Candidatus Omnitrophica bacterium]|nr:M23 family metallopeptidase [Candidatus Omnitrophota bacterium]